jgi:hypothetical protein
VEKWKAKEMAEKPFYRERTAVKQMPRKSPATAAGRETRTHGGRAGPGRPLPASSGRPGSGHHHANHHHHEANHHHHANNHPGNHHQHDSHHRHHGNRRHDDERQRSEHRDHSHSHGRGGASGRLHG